MFVGALVVGLVAVFVMGLMGFRLRALEAAAGRKPVPFAMKTQAAGMLGFVPVRATAAPVVASDHAMGPYRGQLPAGTPVAMLSLSAEDGQELLAPVTPALARELTMQLYLAFPPRVQDEERCFRLVNAQTGMTSDVMTWEAAMGSLAHQGLARPGAGKDVYGVMRLVREKTDAETGKLVFEDLPLPTC